VSKAFSKVGTKQRIRLPFRHIGRELLASLQLMSISNVWIIFPDVHTLKVFFRCRSTARHYDNRTLERDKSANRTLRWARLG